MKFSVPPPPPPPRRYFYKALIDHKHQNKWKEQKQELFCEKLQKIVYKNLVRRSKDD